MALFALSNITKPWEGGQRRGAQEMASLGVGFGAATAAASGRVFVARATKGAGGSTEEKGLLDWILGGLQKQDQLLETDPVLSKVEDKNRGTTMSKNPTNSVSIPNNKKTGVGGGVFGGLFAKK